MTDVPEGPAGVEPERGPRRSQRVGDSGSPVGSTLSIVLAVVAVIAGFLILRAITNDDDDGDEVGEIVTPGSDEPGSDSSTPATGSTDAAGGTTTAPPTTLPARTTTGATVVVANASGIGGSAGAMTTVLEGAGYTMGTAGNSNGEDLSTSVIYYVADDAAAQAVASSVARDLGGLSVAEMPSPPPITEGIGTSTVLVMVGTDTANKTLADLNPSTVTPPTVAGGTTTTT